MEKIKFIVSLLILVSFFACSKLPFSNKEDDKSKQREEELKKREDDVKAKEDALRDQQTQQLENDKQELKKREEELEQKLKDIKVETKVKATGNPADITLALIQNIDSYLSSGNESALKRAYNFWYSPVNSVGTYEKFRKGFSGTLRDKVIDNSVTFNDGYNAEIVIVHSAYEVNPKSSSTYDAYQKSKYEAKYKLISDNGTWKIRSGKVTILSREYSDYYR